MSRGCLSGERGRPGCTGRRLADRHQAGPPSRVFGGTPNTAARMDTDKRRACSFHLHPRNPRLNSVPVGRARFLRVFEVARCSTPTFLKKIRRSRGVSCNLTEERRVCVTKPCRSIPSTFRSVRPRFARAAAWPLAPRQSAFRREETHACRVTSPALKIPA